MFDCRQYQVRSWLLKERVKLFVDFGPVRRLESTGGQEDRFDLLGGRPSLRNLTGSGVFTRNPPHDPGALHISPELLNPMPLMDQKSVCSSVSRQCPLEN